ncbi:metal ABC transporter solute-binding protein, Zn/Mn family, partial [Enterococcus faecium]|uniref:metal ABC transporter solute-binding protein, Zn/Mn family n=1 Tax=Enterococcus faecium TaxID=1352 RepID=UPI0030C88592
MKTKKSLFLILAVSFLVLAGCGKQASDQADEGSKGKLSVVATNSILADMEKEVGTDQRDIHSLVPVGTDPHEDEELPEDIKKESDAAVILYNGFNLETVKRWVENLMEKAKK